MARVKMLKTACGPMGSFLAGKEYEITDDLALSFADAGAVTLLDDPKPQPALKVIERAVVVPPETSTAPVQRPPTKRR